MNVEKNEIFGLMKTMIDAHTMGIYAAAELLRDCEYNVIISPPKIEKALESLESEESQQIILDWIQQNYIQHIGISYRLDPDDAVQLVGKLVMVLKKNQYYETDSAIVKSIYFAGLKPACDYIDQEYAGRIKTFRGGESPEETLLVMGVPMDKIPHKILSGCKYDKKIKEFGKDIIQQSQYSEIKPLEKVYYKEYGTVNDTLIKRLKYNFKEGFQPLIRAHSGPYYMDMTRRECIEKYIEWCKYLAKTGFLDILSIGTSQLSQSNFNENWAGKSNGGGVPVNFEEDFIDIWNAAKPMLVRTYSATKNIQNMAWMYEKTLNIAWHALSLWWFDELDGRGPNTLYDNLSQHIATIKDIALMNKPVEANVPHHFAFRGCDDITYIISEYLAAKMSKKCGIKYFILQNMLNTPRSTWGIQDLAKSRTVLKLVKELENDQFKVIFQTRAGLDYFKPDLEEAKIQLAAVTAMMDDIDPYNYFNPAIIHVVSYSEALFLATPEIINESIKITRKSLSEYRKHKHELKIIDKVENDIAERMDILEKSARAIIQQMEENIPNLYSPEGLYIAFVSGWLPVPELWSESDEFIHAKNWNTKLNNGGIVLTQNNVILSLEDRINKCVKNIPNAKYIFKNKYGKVLI